MSPAPLRFSSLLLACLSSAPVAAERLTVVDVSGDEPLPVVAKAAGGWTLEMGDKLVVVGGAASAETIEVDASRLLLRARGCSEHAETRGRLIVASGRWELREVAAHEVDALLKDASHGWRVVPRDGATATRWRAKGALPADPQVQAVVDALDTSRWFDDVTALAAFDRSSYGTTSLVAARDLIATRFADLDLDVEIMPFTMPGIGGGSITRHNVIGTYTGASQPERWIIVGGHYDSRTMPSTATAGTPGAEDNATGCAGVIELARVLVAAQPEKSIAFMCYAGEEQGLRGSQAHVARLSAQSQFGNIDLVATLDMIGFSIDGDLEALFESSAAQSALLTRYGNAAATYAPELDVVISTNPFGSDHVPYINAGLPAALTIENDWDLYPHYHRSTDTPANIGPHALAMGGAILKTNAALIAEAAGLPASNFAGFADGFE